MAKSSKKKFYVVWKGRKTGIFDDWETCKAQVFEYVGAVYKSFPSLSEAEKAFKSGYTASKSTPSKSSKTITSSSIIANSLSVDAACSGNPGIMEYRGVNTNTKNEIFHIGPLEDGTNNIGEFLAIVHGLALLKKNDKHDTPIYSDSKTAIAWVKKKKANTTLDHTGRNDTIFDLIHRAEEWLRTNTYKNPILKWETDLWGEIPADFGRK